MEPRRSPELGRFAEPSLLILVSLTSDGPKHGYAIMTDVEAGDRPAAGTGTLYAALARLEERGLIEGAPAGGPAPAVPPDRCRGDQPHRTTAWAVGIRAAPASASSGQTEP